MPSSGVNYFPIRINGSVRTNYQKAAFKLPRQAQYNFFFRLFNTWYIYLLAQCIFTSRVIALIALKGQSHFSQLKKSTILITQLCLHVQLSMKKAPPRETEQQNANLGSYVIHKIGLFANRWPIYLFTHQSASDENLGNLVL